MPPLVRRYVKTSFAFLMAGLLCLIAGMSFLMVGRALRPHVMGTQPATASAI